MEEYPNSKNFRPTKYDCVAEPFIKWEVDREKAFDCLQKRAEYCKGIVMPNLDTAIINVVEVKPHNFNSDKPLVEAQKWAEKNLVGLYTAHKNTIDEFEYQISSKAIKKYIQSSNKSHSIYSHLSVLKVLPQIIEESIEVEIHADYRKVNGERSINNPIDKTVLIHRFYGAIKMVNNVYKVKTTIKEHRDPIRSNTPYCFEVIKIMLLDESNSIIWVANGPNSIGGLSINAPKILQNVEKSYDKEKFLLEETKKHAEIVAEFCELYFSKEKQSKKP